MSSQNIVFSSLIFLSKIDRIMHFCCWMRNGNIFRFKIFKFTYCIFSILNDKSHSMSDIFKLPSYFGQEGIVSHFRFDPWQWNIYQILTQLFVNLSNLELIKFCLISLLKSTSHRRQKSAFSFFFFRTHTCQSLELLTKNSLFTQNCLIPRF